jgi:hypothetical protein
MCVCVWIFVCVYVYVYLSVYMCTYMCAFTYINTYVYMCVCLCVVYVYVCMCTYMCVFTYIYTYFMCKYIYVLNIRIFCAIWLKKCDFLTEKLGIKPDPDRNDLFRIRIRILQKVPYPAGSGSTTLT